MHIVYVWQVKCPIVIHLECIRSESWIYSIMGQNNGLHAFGYNSAESELICT